MKTLIRILGLALVGVGVLSIALLAAGPQGSKPEPTTLILKSNGKVFATVIVLPGNELVMESVGGITEMRPEGRRGGTSTTWFPKRICG